jgi:uncharacterized membrane protein
MDILFIALIVLAFFLGVSAMIRAHKVKKFYKNLDENADKKFKYSLRAVIFVHYSAGLLMVITITLFGVFLVMSLLNGGEAVT